MQAIILILLASSPFADADSEATAIIAIEKARTATVATVATPDVAPPARIVPSAGRIPIDGELSPLVQWRWNTTAWAWQPVERAAQGYSDRPRGAPTYVEGSTYFDHLTRDHGVDPAYCRTLTLAQQFALHSDIHSGLVERSRVVWAGGCANGQCDKPNSFRRVWRSY